VPESCRRGRRPASLRCAPSPRRHHPALHHPSPRRHHPALHHPIGPGRDLAGSS
jgi:hypothetical protein